MSKCRVCNEHYTISQRESELLLKISGDILSQLGGDSQFALPPSALCPDCRQQRRLGMRNERKLYQRDCGLCRKKFIGIYSPEKPDNAYCAACWWGDGWDPLNFGRDYDPSRSFFDQFNDLYRTVPKLGLVILGENVNSDYTNDNYRLKNCYLVYDGEQGVDCMYGETFSNLKDCLDFHTLQFSELCYECINCSECYDLRYSRFCQNCVSSWLLIDCIGCKNCIGCANLHQKQYSIFNKQYSPEEYRKQLESFQLSSRSGIEALRAQCEDFFEGQAKRHLRGIRNENSTGDNLNGAKDSFDSYDGRDIRDCGYTTNLLMGAQDCLDVNVWGDNLSLAYNCACVGNGAQNVVGCFYVWSSCHSIYHSAFCSRNCHHLFGCVGLRHKEYYILNKQYSPEDYKALIRTIVSNMKNAGEWGEFFPPEISSFGYNETVAQEYFPIGRKQAEAIDYSWSEYESPRPAGKLLTAKDVPNSLEDAPEDICSATIECEVTKRPFRIGKAELEFYRKQQLPIPVRHPDQRHIDRLQLRNPRYLWDRKCASCQKDLKTSYAPLRKERILCDDCYREEFLS